MSTAGIELATPRRRLAEAVELLSSMRFAISLLTIIAIASVLGTLVEQGQPMPNYVDQFGPFWFEVFAKFGIFTVYSTWWFLLIMGFLVVSTTLCIIRNTPKMMRDMRSWRENVRESSLRNFHHHAEFTTPLARAAFARQTVERLGHAGYAARTVEKEGGTLVTAKKGAGTKFGYVFAHSAIVIICLGGLLDSDLPIRFQEWFFGKTPYAGAGFISAIPAQHRLGVNNPTFRANTQIAEGQTSDTAIIPRQSGVLVQELPVDIKLNKFNIDFYSTGMPKLFASEVVVRDKETGKTFPATIKVNEPLIYKGIAVYQSSFEDGGSKLQLTGFPMAGPDNTSFAINGEVNDSTGLKRGTDEYTVEWTNFRPFNVENLGSGDARAVKKNESFNEQFARSLDKHTGSAAKNANSQDLKNVGPSVQFKLRDKNGQAREFINYMQPVTLDGVQLFLSGVRASQADNFSYLRIPADDEHSVREWMRLRAALHNPELRATAAARYAERAMPASSANTPLLARQLQESALKGITIFAGEGRDPGGFMAVMRFLEKIPEKDRENAAAIYMRLLNGTMWELWQAARAKDGLAPVEPTVQHGQWLTLSTNALADAVFYGAPVYLQLDDFTQIKASVLQVTRSPGKKVVYLGCLLLVLGVFAMFYIRERRVWVWLRDNDGGADGTHALMAMNSQRKTLDFEKEFTDMKAKLPQSA
ncbi:cytochrome c biogenesis protein ResB [Massilia arenosa]|uniref:Cytochrome c biogenesis protein ResB n=1 Tax=Zemynaea arenosa TaxID=2561931 RepID=A0A4Y9SHF8_9BURK|nr:cytochrome c biogenesis protein ResB [Massilia arenosa]TFW21074.1 cytochrome c biogenesis protein ResB [Massilia arenosa]